MSGRRLYACCKDLRLESDLLKNILFDCFNEQFVTAKAN